MTVMENFNQGLLITGLGMGLVFLTLIIVMLLIKLLDLAFRPKEEAVSAAAAIGKKAMLPDAAKSALKAALDMSDEAAAIAVAIALGRGRQGPVLYDEDIPGEVVMVNTIAAGPGTWSGQGRLRGMQ